MFASGQYVTDGIMSKYVKFICSCISLNTGGSISSTNCCLGVACRIIHPRKDFKNSGTLSSYNTKSIKIPDILKGDNSKKSYDYNPVVDKLINMNDMLDKDFNQIANWIEKNL